MATLPTSLRTPAPVARWLAAKSRNERRTWGVIALCSVMMAAEIVGGLLFGSIALVEIGRAHV